MAISLDKLTSFHHRAVRVRTDRMEVIAGNLANQNTPGYKARDINFKEAMSSARYQQSMHLEKTSDKHISGRMVSNTEMGFRVPTQPDTGDGNTVEAQIERNQFLDNGLRYQASLQFLDGKLKGMKKAITGGQGG
jgi:flagellar basal-body rod protein FlgB